MRPQPQPLGGTSGRKHPSLRLSPTQDLLLGVAQARAWCPNSHEHPKCQGLVSLPDRKPETGRPWGYSRKARGHHSVLLQQRGRNSPNTETGPRDEVSTEMN